MPTKQAKTRWVIEVRRASGQPWHPIGKSYDTRAEAKAAMAGMAARHPSFTFRVAESR